MRDSRTVSIRYFNLYRIVVASAFAIFGGVMSFGQKSPELFAATVILYWVLAFAFLLLHAGSPRYGERTLGVQITLDILVLASFLYTSGGYRSGLPFLMMTTIAGAGLVGQGRMVLGAAALATITVLAEQVLRVWQEGAGVAEFPQVGIVCLGFFAVALIARMLARRALANEALARQRGDDLARQMRINARIIEDMQEGVIVISADGVVRQANPRADDLLGARLDPGRPLARCAPALAGLGHDAVQGLRLPEAEGQGARSLQVRRVATGESGDVILYVEDMDRALTRARQIKLAALGRLTANIAHEIRNPLSSVSHAGELLLEEKRVEVQQRLVRIIHDNTARIERIVRDVLELGRRDRVVPERLELGAFCRAFLDEYVERNPAAAQAVVLAPHDPCWLDFDRTHAYQILANLLDNACRHGSGTPGSVVVRVRALDEGHGELRVEDDGPGVPATDRGKLFEPFFTSAARGTGLGLYTARELAEANGASLEFIEAEGGAKFRLGFRRSE
ncbi:MAG: HAMP domain-containing sensor histidine kinase [Candidatus Dactylopiibacterium sp.]|nr:HAMP domain-containing sensor histidine kinase [Candidatus Dactylopiibacterium sp.]